RSEFQYLGRENYPREGEQYRVYRQVAQAMGNRRVIIRTVDLGADKQANYMNLPDELNPAMGNRGIRVCLDRKKMFRAQIRAIYRASIYGNLSIMYPMITSMEEVEEIWKIVSEVKVGLDQKEIPYKDIQNGIMVETPAAAMICPELARRADFISLGTNDLTQYVLAMDAQNPQLEKKFDKHHPAVLRMMEMVIEDAHKAGKEVLICGELAAESGMIPYFLRLGVDALSMAPACILPARKVVRELDLKR
ncbi:MAG: putative PEP-binding protein, partial [Blautia sp.]